MAKLQGSDNSNDHSTVQTVPTLKRGGLAGIRIAITRAMHQADSQRTLLERAGAEVFHYPCIAIGPLRKTDLLDSALQQMAGGGFDWLVLTSTNTVTALAARLEALSLDPAKMGDLKIAAVGAGTAEAVEASLGLAVAFVPPTFTAESLAATIPVAAGDRLLLPQSAIARPTVADALHSKGVDITVVDAYRTLIAQGGDDLLGMLWAGSIDAITFTSESTVRYFGKRVQHERGALAMLDHVVIGSIGPVTSAAIQRLGLRVQVQPEEHTLVGLTDALIDYFDG